VIISQAYESASQSISLDQMPGAFSKSSKISFGSLPQPSASYTHMPQAAPASSPSMQLQAPQQSYFARSKSKQATANTSYFTNQRKRSGPSWLTILLMIAIAVGSYFLGRQSQAPSATAPTKRQPIHAPQAGTQPTPSKRSAQTPPHTRPTQRTPARTTPKQPTRETNDDDKNNKNNDDDKDKNDDQDDKNNKDDDDKDDTSPSNKRPVERPSDPEPRPKARKRKPAPRSISPKQQALLDQTAAFNKGWIGSLCTKDSSCETKDATCLPGRNGGFCSMSCTTVCPDRKGATPSYCVNTPLAKRAGDDAKGLCLPRCNYRMFPGRGCRLGAICRKMTWRRFPKRKRYVCVPVLAK
jgi:hypothetical protein